MSHPAHRPGTAGSIPSGRQIVVGVDGSTASVAALAWAATEARLRQAELRAVYAWEDMELCRAPYAARRGVPSRGEARAAAAALLSASVHAVFGPAAPPWLRAELADGRPEQVLPSRAAGSEILVLGGTRRAAGWPVAPGPVHRACLHGAPCPVTIVGWSPPARGCRPAASGKAGARLTLSSRSPCTAASGAAGPPG